MHAGRAPEARPAGSFSGARWREAEGARDAELARAATSFRGAMSTRGAAPRPCAVAPTWSATLASAGCPRPGAPRRLDGERLERGREQVLRRRFQGLGEALQDREPRIGLPVLDAVEEGAADAHHQAESLLVDLRALAQPRDVRSQHARPPRPQGLVLFGRMRGRGIMGARGTPALREARNRVDTFRCNCGKSADDPARSRLRPVPSPARAGTRGHGRWPCPDKGGGRRRVAPSSASFESEKGIQPTRPWRTRRGSWTASASCRRTCGQGRTERPIPAPSRALSHAAHSSRRRPRRGGV